jgi:hypothetical protein
MKVIDIVDNVIYFLLQMVPSYSHHPKTDQQRR